MNALPSFEPPEDRLPSRTVSRSRQTRSNSSPAQILKRPEVKRRSRVKSNPAYAHRRQGLEVSIKLVTYSSLSLFGLVTLVNSLGYNWAQQSKLGHLATELQDARFRTAKVNRNFTHSFDPQLEQTVMEENSYKVAPNRLQVVLANPTSDRSVTKTPSK